MDSIPIHSSEDYFDSDSSSSGEEGETESKGNYQLLSIKCCCSAWLDCVWCEKTLEWTICDEQWSKYAQYEL